MRRPSRRITIRIVIALALGAASSWAVAIVALHDVAIRVPPAPKIPSTTWIARAGAPWPDAPTTTVRDRRFAHDLWYQVAAIEVQTPASTFSAGSPGTPFQLDGPVRERLVAIQFCLDAGWPARAHRLAVLSRAFEPIRPGTPPRGLREERLRRWPVPRFLGLQSWLGRSTLYVPAEIIWPGFLLNTVIHGLVALGLITGLGRVLTSGREARRRRRGRCAACGYPHRDGPCPECGALTA